MNQTQEMVKRCSQLRRVLMLCLIASGCSNVDSKDRVRTILIYQLRIPKGTDPNPNTNIGLVDSGGESGTFLHAATQSEEANFLVFEHHFLLHEDTKRSLVLYTQPKQIFTLPIPRVPEPTEWTIWKLPDVTATGDVGWALMTDQELENQSRDVSPDSFELRYRIEQRNHANADQQ